MSTPAPPRSLADDLRSRSADQIALLLYERSDLAEPWPADLSQLARRAADDASVLEAMQSLNTTELRVLEVYAAMVEATVDQVAAVLPEPLADVQQAVARLHRLALLWGAPAHRIVRAAQQAFGPFPCGLVAAGHTTVQPQAVREAAMEFDPQDLADLVWHNPVREQGHPLLTQRAEAFVLSREAALVLRDGMYLEPAPPAPVEREPANAAGEFLWGPVAGVRYLVCDLSRQALPCHAERGVSRRAVADRADVMSVPQEDLMVWLELAAGAGLVGIVDGAVRPTAQTQEWLQADADQMWLTLMQAWLDSDRLLTWARPEELGCMTTASRPRVGHHRRQLLSAWPKGARVDSDEFADIVGWNRPRMHEALEQSDEFYAEVHALGLAEAGVATAALHTLLDDPVAAAALVPQSQGEATLVVQPDHTVIAPANLDHVTWMLLYRTSVLESWGPVTMHRFELARIRTSLAGSDPQDILQTLRVASRTPLPQSLEYLIADAARGAAARVRRATLVEVPPSDVESVRAVGLEQVSDLVFASDLDEDIVRRRLAEAGLATTHAEAPPVAEPLDYPHKVPVPDTRAVTRLVGHLVEGVAVTEDPPTRLVEVDPQTMADVCRSAIAEVRRLWLAYTVGDTRNVELVEPVDLRSGRLTGWSLSSNRAITVPLSKIAAYQETS